MVPHSIGDREVLELCADTWDQDCDWVMDPAVLDTPDPPTCMSSWRPLSWARERDSSPNDPPGPF